MTPRRSATLFAILLIALTTAFVAGQSTGSEASDTDPTAVEYTVTVRGLVLGETYSDNTQTTESLLGVNVTIYWDGGSATGITDRNGEFEIDNVPEDTAVTISFAYPGKTVVRWYGSIMKEVSGSDRFSITIQRTWSDTYDLRDYPVTMRDTKLELQVMTESSGGNIPLSGTTVTILDAFGQADVQNTDKDGNVSLSIGSVYGLRIAVDYPDGYSFIPGLFFMNVINSGTGEWVIFDLVGEYDPLGVSYSIPKTDYSTEGRIYTIGDPLLVSASTATVTISVYDSNKTPLQGATVTLQHTENPNIKYTVITDRNGTASFLSVTTATYSLTIQVNGFEEYNGGTVDVIKGAIPLPDAIMTPKTVTTWFGINLSHVMMIVGIFIGVILAIISILLFTRHLKGTLEKETE